MLLQVVEWVVAVSVPMMSAKLIVIYQMVIYLEFLLPVQFARTGRLQRVLCIEKGDLLDEFFRQQ
ncbi:hypothetical protein [Pseudomonas sp. PB3P13]